jgi:hypothetical protein
MASILRAASGGAENRTPASRPTDPDRATDSGNIDVSLLVPKELPKMPHPIARTYLSLGAFYASDPARRSSRERDFGLFWRSRSGPSFRAAWVRDTGELYLFQHALGGRGGGSVHLLAPAMDEIELERRLTGWADVCGREGSLEWLLARVQGISSDGAPLPASRRFRRHRISSLRLGPAGAPAA